MRIIGGEFKGRRFHPPAKNWPTRPTTDFAKEGLFNILQNKFDFEEITVLDLFGGTGSHSYEFISRGCKDVTTVDRHAGCIKFIKKTTEELEIQKYIKVLKMDVFKFIKLNDRKFDYIFAGPPYPLATIPQIPDLIFKHNMLKENGLFVLEHNPNHIFNQHPNFKQSKNYGTTIFSFFISADEL